MDDLEEMLEELKNEQTYVIYKRSLPPGINKVIAQNIPSYKDALEFIKTMKLKTHDVMDGDNKVVIYYDVLPEGLRLKDVYYNDPKITTVGNNRKRAAINYMGLED